MSGHPAVSVFRRDHALWAQITRPQAGNACNSEVMDALEHWLDLADGEDVRVLVLTGSDRVFCAGADLAEGTSLLDDPPALHAFLGRGRRLVRRLRSAPVPTIAAVNGAAYGGGLELLLACDLAVATHSARIGDRHIAVGQVPGWGSSVMLPLAVGPVLARRLLLTGESLTGTEAEACGLVSAAVAEEDLEEKVDQLAGVMTSWDKHALSRMLQLIRADHDEEDAWALEWQTLVAHLDDQRSGVVAKVQRAPRQTNP